MHQIVKLVEGNTPVGTAGGQQALDESGAHGAEALALAERILQSLRTHPWEGNAGGLKGPHQLPAPLGALFPSLPQEHAA